VISSVSHIFNYEERGVRMTEIILDWSTQPKSRKKSLLDEYDELQLDQTTPMSFNEFRPSEVKKDKEAKALEQAEETADDDWEFTLSQFRTPKVKASRNYKNSEVYDFLHGGSGKKKKKKKKEKEGPKDYNEEFEPDIALMRNMLEDATRFTDSLQKRYYALESSRSSARGVGKFTTDLISSINQSRSVSSQLLNNITSLKKNIADLNMKERKEAAAANGGLDAENLNDFSSNFLRKLIQQDRSDSSIYGDAVPVDADEDTLYANISDMLANEDDRSETERFLKYENRNVEIVAFVDEKTDDYTLKAIAEDGEILDDYPIPEIESFDINRSTGLGVDEYHNHYRIEWI
jgi:hypothetical protein